MKAFVFENYKDQFYKINKFLNIEKVEFEIIKFRNGEGKIIISESVKDEDVLIFSDFSFPLFYKYLNHTRQYSKDEYCMELKRLISALDYPKSISVFLPNIYQNRQNTNNERESKDYLMFINELKHLGVSNILTVENHGDTDNVISYSLSPLFIDRDYDVVVSPDTGGIKRSKEYSKILNCDNFNFIKKRDLTSFVDGANPIKEYVKGKYDFTNKKVLIVDDILDSGSTLIKAISSINNAIQVDVFVSYAYFNRGFKEFKKLIKVKKLNKIYVSNLIYLNKKILKNKYIEVLDCSELVAKYIKEVK